MDGRGISRWQYQIAQKLANRLRSRLWHKLLTATLFVDFTLIANAAVVMNLLVIFLTMVRSILRS